MTTVEVVNYRTGEVLGEQLDHVPAETLADAYMAIREYQARLEDMRKLVKAELQGRLDMRGVARMTVGDFEVGESHGTRSRWDGVELERVVRELIDAGAIDARDVTGLLTHEVKVNGHAANSLSRRLVGQHKAAVEDCRTREDERRAFDVVPSLPLVGEQQG